MKIHVGDFGGGGKKPKISTDFCMCVVGNMQDQK